MTTKNTVGILAYGSLITDPGEEISGATVETRGPILTPFNVEFARTSTRRAGAPTLVPVEHGLPVSAYVFVLNVPEDEAAHRLWRREINVVGSGRAYRRPMVVNENSVLVERRDNFANLDVVLYTRIAANIAPLSAQKLAELAIESAGKIKDGRDGVSYLIAAKRSGIKTILSDAYEQEILRRVGAESLEGALARLRGAPA